MRHWSEPFVGLPWLAGGRDMAACDCWGLVRLVYRVVLKVELEAFDDRYATTEERAEIAALIAGEKIVGKWREIAPGAEADFDVIVFNCFGHESHVGLIAGRGMMLHATQGRLSGLERYLEGKWRPRIRGFYRHAMRATP